jgi:taurine dioxygenase
VSAYELVKQAGSAGAVITGLDLREPADDELVARLRGDLVEHLVICIRGQAEMTPDDQVAFARRWGTIVPHPYVEPIEGHPEMIRIYDPNPLTETWHADFTYERNPPAISMLLARVIPAYGGDTMFSNAYRVFDDLGDGFKDALRGMRALHQGTELAMSKGLSLEDITTVHPVVARHPETGRELLNVNGAYVKHLDGWTVEESDVLLGYIYGLFGHPEYTYRHHWQVGDLLIWDNRCVQHRAVADTDGQQRDLHRVTVALD